MTDKVQKIREEVERLKEWQPIATPSLNKLLSFLDTMQEEPVSEELEKAAEEYAYTNWASDDYHEGAAEGLPFDAIGHTEKCFKAGANWQKKHLLKPADGDELPEIDREVIAILDNGKVVFAHRPPEFWDGKNIVTGKVTRNYPKTYDKGGWNIPNVKYWLDYSMPKEIEL